MISRRSRPAFAWLPAFTALALMAIGVWAGMWQSKRAIEKDRIEAHVLAARDGAVIHVGPAPLDAAVLDGRRVVARGEFLPAATLYWDNRFAGRVAGMAVVTPLRLAGGERVLLVDRGVVVPGPDRSRLPAVGTPAGTVEVHGRAYLAPRRTLELKDNADSGSLWQNLTPEKFTTRAGLATQPFILRQSDETGAQGLLRAPDAATHEEGGMTAAKHRGYAFQWYSLSLLVFLLFVFFTFFRHDKPSRDP